MKTHFKSLFSGAYFLRIVGALLAVYLMIHGVYEILTSNSIELHHERKFHFIKGAVKVLGGACWFVLQLWLTITKDDKIENSGNLKQREPKTAYEHDIERLISGIDHRIDRLITSANVNLTIGLMFTIFTALCAYYMLFYYPGSVGIKSNNAWLISRSALTLLFGSFSFFFLRNYTNLKNDITYFQNERSNVLNKSIATQLMVDCNFSELLRDSGTNEASLSIINSYMHGDRNYKLGKDETNMRLSAMEKENDTLKILLDHVNRK